MTRRAVLHIGTEKTGTTTLQYALAMSGAALAEAGYRYPSLGAGNAHAAVVAYAADDTALADLHALGGRAPTETRDAFDSRIAAELAAESAAHPTATFILSSEHASSRLATDASVARLKRLLDRHFDRIDVVVYLRRWDRMAVSAHATFVQNGDSEPFSFARFRDTTYLDYVGLLARWSGAFGHDRLHVGIYDRGALRDGSIVADFAARFDLPVLHDPAEANVTPSFDTIAVLALLNRSLARVDTETAAHVRAALVDAKAPGGIAPVSRAEAAAFVAHHAVQAEELRARYFPDRAEVFDCQFDDYPAFAPDTARNWRDVTHALVGAIGRTARNTSSLTATNAYLQARVLMSTGHWGEARASIVRALTIAPDTADFLHILGLIELNGGNRAIAREVAHRAAALDPDNKAHRNLIAAIG